MGQEPHLKRTPQDGVIFSPKQRWLRTVILHLKRLLWDSSHVPKQRLAFQRLVAVSAMRWRIPASTSPSSFVITLAK